MELAIGDGCNRTSYAARATFGFDYSIVNVGIYKRKKDAAQGHLCSPSPYKNAIYNKVRVPRNHAGAGFPMRAFS